MSFDYTIFWVLAIIIGITGLTFGVAYLRKKNIVSEADLLFVSSILGVSIEIIDELNLKNESQILKITNIIQDSLNFAIGIFNNNNKEEVYNKAVEYAFNLCEQSNITLTDNRKNIIKQLLKAGIESKLING